MASREGLKGLTAGPWKTRIAETENPPRVTCGGMATTRQRAAVYGNRGRLKSAVGKSAMRKPRRNGSSAASPIFLIEAA